MRGRGLSASTWAKAAPAGSFLTWMSSAASPWTSSRRWPGCRARTRRKPVVSPESTVGGRRISMTPASLMATGKVSSALAAWSVCSGITAGRPAHSTVAPHEKTDVTRRGHRRRGGRSRGLSATAGEGCWPRAGDQRAEHQNEHGIASARRKQRGKRQLIRETGSTGKLGFQPLAKALSLWNATPQRRAELRQRLENFSEALRDPSGVDGDLRAPLVINLRRQPPETPAAKAAHRNQCRPEVAIHPGAPPKHPKTSPATGSALCSSANPPPAPG